MTVTNGSKLIIFSHLEFCSQYINSNVPDALPALLKPARLQGMTALGQTL
jgi:hypothetical protein